MSRPTARVLALLEILQAGGTHTAADLAARLGVDERTARRYVEHLLDLEVPVWTARGRYGGFRLAPGFRMPPLMLTDEEAVAVLLGLLTGRRDATVPVTASESATAKVRRVLPTKLGQRIDALLATTAFTTAGPTSPAPETATLLVLAEAALDRHPVRLDYRDREGRESTRTLHPYAVVAHRHRWYVTGEDPEREGVRSLRVDRITRVSPQPGSFDVPTGFDPADELVTGFAKAPYRHTVRVLVRGPVERVRSSLPAALATVEDAVRTDLPEGQRWSRVTIRAESLHWVPALLASTGFDFVVEGPAQLREEVRALAIRLTACADATSPTDLT